MKYIKAQLFKKENVFLTLEKKPGRLDDIMSSFPVLQNLIKILIFETVYKVF